MSTSHIYHTQGIRNFHYIKEDYIGNAVLIYIERHPDKYECSRCQSKNVSKIKAGERQIKGLKSGKRQTYFMVPMHRLICYDCGCSCFEHLEFISRPKVHYTRAVERTVIELRSEMSIQALANYLGLNWHTVKDIEKINAIRRSTMNKLDDHLKEKLKGERWLFLRNIENLNQDETMRLE